MVNFKGAQYPKDVILYAVFFYVRLRYGVSYRDLEEIMAERGVPVDHSTLNRWVIRLPVKLNSINDLSRVLGAWMKPTSK
jgi:putative transposase